MSRYPCRSTLYTKKKTCPNCCTEEDDSRVADRYWWDLESKKKLRSFVEHTDANQPVIIKRRAYSTGTG